VALIGGGAGPWVTGALHDRLGSYTLAFAICVALSGLSGLAIWRAAPGARRGRPHASTPLCILGG
jgi:cyanate permease